MQQQLSGLIDLGTLRVDALMPDVAPTHVTRLAATVADARAAALESGHMRILMIGDHREPPRVVTCAIRCSCRIISPRWNVPGPPSSFEAQTPVYEALGRMRGAARACKLAVSDGQ